MADQGVGVPDADMPGAGTREAEGPSEDPVIDAMPDVGDTDAGVARPEERRATSPPARPAPAPSVIDMLMENILAVGAGLLVLLLLLVYFLRNRLPWLKRGGDQPLPTRPGADGEDEFAGVRLSDDSLIVDEFAEDADEDSGIVESIGGYTAPDEEAYAAQFETGDALAEADIYIAYGRFPQAVGLLSGVLEDEPERNDVRMKLLEVFAEVADGIDATAGSGPS